MLQDSSILCSKIIEKVLQLKITVQFVFLLLLIKLVNNGYVDHLENIIVFLLITSMVLGLLVWTWIFMAIVSEKIAVAFTF